MQQCSNKKNTPVIIKITNLSLILVMAVAAMFLNGCAVKNVYRFSSSAVTKISYDPKNCAETVDGKFKCKDVVFTVAAVEPAKSK